MIKLLLILVMSGALAGTLSPSEPPPLLIQDTTSTTLDAAD